MNIVDQLVAEGKEPLDAVFYKPTPEELAEDERRDILKAWRNVWKGLTERERKAVNTLVGEKVASAVAAEREACAQIALTHGLNHPGYCKGGPNCWHNIAAAIRAKPKTDS